MIHRVISQLVRWLARGLLLGFFNRVEITGRSHLAHGRPTLVVANHFNGFVDPVVLAVALEGLPRFVAKASLRKVPLLGALMGLVGVVFIERPQDNEGTGENVDAFADCRRALAGGDVVAIFPEGTTHDEARLAPVKTGAARIALGARAGGLEDLVIVPVGLTFHDKLALRSAVLVRIGTPIALDTVVPALAADLHRGDEGRVDESADNHELVRDLTAEITSGLRAVAPDFDDVEEWHALEYAAEVALRHPGKPEPDLADRVVLAHRLGQTAAEVRRNVRRSIADYNLSLTLAHLHDREVAVGLSNVSLLTSAATAALAVGLLGPIALSGLAVNAIPLLLVLLASSRVKVPVTKGTVRVLVALVAFPITWMIAAYPVSDQWGLRFLLAATYALGGFFAMIVTEQAITLFRRILAWRSIREREALVEPLRVRRTTVEEVVTEALLSEGTAEVRPFAISKEGRRDLEPTARAEAAEPVPRVEAAGSAGDAGG